LAASGRERRPGLSGPDSAAQMPHFPGHRVPPPKNPMVLGGHYFNATLSDSSMSDVDEFVEGRGPKSPAVMRNMPMRDSKGVSQCRAELGNGSMSAVHGSLLARLTEHLTEATKIANQLKGQASAKTSEGPWLVAASPRPHQRRGGSPCDVLGTPTARQLAPKSFVEFRSEFMVESEMLSSEMEDGGPLARSEGYAQRRATFFSPPESSMEDSQDERTAYYRSDEGDPFDSQVQRTPSAFGRRDQDSNNIMDIREDQSMMHTLPEARDRKSRRSALGRSWFSQR
jgi:hypothetical protein